MKKGTNFGGVIPPVVTPFNASDSIDEDKFRREVQYLLSCGIHGISPGGSTGEGAALTDEDLSTLITIVKEENRKGLPIIAGVIRASTQAAVKTARAARAAGADALMVTPVFYNVLVPDAKGNELFYRIISQEVGLPIIVYNVVPQNEITPETFSRLIEIPNVVGIKQSVGGIMAFYDMKITNGDKGMVYSATDEMIYSTFDLGADGAISAILSLFPELCVRMWDAVRKGNNAEAKRIQDEIYPVWKLVRGPQFPARMKAALKLMGRDCGISRSPMSEVSIEQVAEMKKRLSNIDVE
ncbi:MAG TPA: dihydrodipicolinate synthase family protein [Rectinemataceae bacterium]|nr:dihydrodipicolinate synthase family protein [Rectinemataceae bacterium]